MPSIYVLPEMAYTIQSFFSLTLFDVNRGFVFVEILALL